MSELVDHWDALKSQYLVSLYSSTGQQAEEAEETFLWKSSPFLGVIGKAYKLELEIAVETEQENDLDIEIVLR